MNPVHPVIAASKPFYLAVFCLKKKSGHQEVWTPMSIAHVYRPLMVPVQIYHPVGLRADMCLSRSIGLRADMCLSRSIAIQPRRPRMNPVEVAGGRPEIACGVSEGSS